MWFKNSNLVDINSGVTRRVLGLRRKKAESVLLREFADDPDLVVVEIESQLKLLTRGMWFFLALGLGYTTAGVQEFLAGHLSKSHPLWWAAWLVEPMLAGILILLLRFESEILYRNVSVNSDWVQRLKRTLLGATLFMNVWPTLTAVWIKDERFNFGSFVIHLIVPLVVFMVAEIMPVIHQRMNQAIVNALRAAVVAPPIKNEHASTVMNQATSAAEPRLVPKVATVDSIRLPDSIREILKAKASRLAAEGRSITADDVLDTVRLPADMAQRIAIEIQANNRNTIT